MPVYVGNSMSLSETGLGGTVEEEMEAFRQVVKIASERLRDVVSPPGAMPNGVWDI